jgi:hypothetical protein
MALAVAVNFTITDAKGKSATTKVHVPTGFAIADYIEFGTAMGQIIADLSDGVLTNISISLPLSLSGATIRAAAALAADVAKKGLFIAGSAISGLFARFNIPTYDEDHTVDNTDEMDLADAEVAAVVAIIEGGAGGASPCDLRGNNLTDVLSGREIFQKFN